jgi:predicted N-acyltransferase
LRKEFGNTVQLALARQHGEIVAVALMLRSASTLYGRYWGTCVDLPDLHFELCYYQGIAYAITHGLQRFEPGAQGEHKLARGFLPTRTHSRHYLVHDAFRAAVRRALAHEHEGMDAYAEELREHTPYAQTKS